MTLGFLGENPLILHKELFNVVKIRVSYECKDSKASLDAQ